MNKISPILSKDIGETYIILPFFKRLKIGETISGYIQDQGNIDIGKIVEILILNRLWGFHTPLYGMSKWAADHTIDEIYGIDSEKLNDDRIGRALDKVFLHMQTLDSQLTINLLKEFDVDMSAILFDASSYSVSGKPLKRAGDPESIKITYGRSSKGKKDERQVRFALAVSAKGAIPLLGKAYSGNTQDYKMHPEFLKELREIIGKASFLIVADSKFDTNNNLAEIFEQGGLFLCPGVFHQTLKEKLIKKLDRGLKWEELDYATKADKKKAKNKRPYYKGYETKAKLEVMKNGKKKTYKYRLIYIYSSENDLQMKKTRGKKIKKIIKELELIRSRLNKRKYKEKVYIKKKVEQAINLNNMGQYFKTNVYKRDGVFYLEYGLMKKELKALEKLDGIYTLKTNLEKATYSINKILHTYKKQTQIEERIKVTKGPLKVAPVYLKDPKRIAALFFIIVQALKVYCVIEQETRKGIEAYGQPIPILPEGRMSMRPTGETILKAFTQGISLIYFKDSSGNLFRELTKPNELQELVFSLLSMRLPDLRSLSRKFGSTRCSAPP